MPFYSPHMRLSSENNGLGSLTRADLEVLRLAAAGLLSVEIAEYLGCSTADVQHCFRRVIPALGARSKLEAVVIALRHGLIERLEA
jgi:DNA-binding NarL/FixJ family response regulator